MTLLRRALALALPLALALGVGPAGATPGDLGHDVSDNQCNTNLPAGDAFLVVNLNSGRPYEFSACASDQLSYAGDPAMVYLNTANPAPTSSYYWPASGAMDPVLCADATVTTDPGCAYDYGWEAAERALLRSDQMARGGAWTRDRVWWLDVENGPQGNSWNGDTWSNAAVLQGMADRLRKGGVVDVGIYSLPSMWDEITGGYSRSTASTYRAHWGFTPAYPLEDGPVWFAGLNDQADAAAKCATTGLTLGEVLLSQYDDSGLDGDVRCADRDLVAPTPAMGEPRSVVTTGTVPVSWTASDDATGVASYDLRRMTATYGGLFSTPKVVGSRLLATSTTSPRPLRGQTACWSVRARDVAGNLSGWSGARCTAVPLDDKDLAASSGWTRSAPTTGSWFNASYTSSTQLGATLTKTGVKTSRLQVLAVTCPTCGKVTVLLDGKALATLNLASSTTAHRWFSLPRFSYRTSAVQLKVATSGRLVRVDGLLTSRV